MLNNEIFIIGGGNSLRGLDFNILKDKNTIVVNKALFHVPSPTYFITMDYSFLTRDGKDFLRKYNLPKYFIVNLVEKYGLKYDNGKIVDTRNNLTYTNLESFLKIISYKEKGIGIKWDNFVNGKSSGFCALQLAILLGYNKINLLGIDLTCEENTHFHEGYAQNRNKFKMALLEYYEFFKIGLEQIKILKPNLQINNCSEISKLKNIIGYKPIEELL